VLTFSKIIVLRFYIISVFQDGRIHQGPKIAVSFSKRVIVIMINIRGLVI